MCFYQFFYSFPVYCLILRKAKLILDYLISHLMHFKTNLLKTFVLVRIRWHASQDQKPILYFLFTSHSNQSDLIINHMARESSIFDFAIFNRRRADTNTHNQLKKLRHNKQTYAIFHINFSKSFEITFTITISFSFQSIFIYCPIGRGLCSQIFIELFALGSGLFAVRLLF